MEQNNTIKQIIMENREIKFRALFRHVRTREEMWFQSMPNHTLENMDGWVQLSSWLQYTGLKDKNGVEIYEGDIIEMPNGKRFKIQYKKSLAGFIRIHLETNQMHEFGDAWTGEVIGNIHQHKHLLENE